MIRCKIEVINTDLPFLFRGYYQDAVNTFMSIVHAGTLGKDVDTEYERMFVEECIKHQHLSLKDGDADVWILILKGICKTYLLNLKADDLFKIIESMQHQIYEMNRCEDLEDLF
ncbi:MAG: hypothetical protein KatS3mg087_1906 [Patescibacteria group bacterium]|nr:MAG: hypothetical protein KatS3mg087_1906 [Patescibacteria group bacterium]